MPEPVGPSPGKPLVRPWWVKAFIVAGILALLSGVLPGGPGGHGPGRHVLDGAPASTAPASP
jgi:hypothetical protein